MAIQRHPILAREGWAHILIVLIAAIAVHGWAGWLWALPLWLALIFVVQFFRDPIRKIPSDPRGVVCPADGKIVHIGPSTDPFLDRPAFKISVFMNVFSVHSNRSPVTGLIKDRWYHKGRFVNAALDKASQANERNALWIQTEEGEDVVCVQVAGLIARRILCYSQTGDRIEQGERFGFIRFGSRVDLYLPPQTRALVQLGDSVSAGSDLLAQLVGDGAATNSAIGDSRVASQGEQKQLG